jgi:DNA-binding NarL/FixJ family response regulator
VISAGPPERSVVIQDRSRLFREGLALLFGSMPGIGAVDTVADGPTLETFCAEQSRDCVLFEAAGVPWEVDGLVRRLRTQMKEREPVLVGTHPPIHRQQYVIEGVSYLPRTSSSEALACALRGEPWTATGASHAVPTSDELSELLSRREIQVLALIGGGLTTMEIGKRLGISPKNVESRRQSIFSKFGVQNQSHAVAVAMRSGLLGQPSGRDDKL